MKTFYVLVFAAALLLVTVLLFLGFGGSFLPGCLTLSDRLSLMQLAVDVIGFSVAIYAGWFAAREFVESQLKPHLGVTSDNAETSIKLPRLNVARNAPIKVYVHNSGNGVGRFISLRLEMPPKLEVALDDEDATRGWRREYDADKEQFLISFRGTDDFICYKGFPLYAGKFRVRLEAGSQTEEYRIHWWALADNMDAKEGDLCLKVSPGTNAYKAG